MHGMPSDREGADESLLPREPPTDRGRLERPPIGASLLSVRFAESNHVDAAKSIACEGPRLPEPDGHGRECRIGKVAPALLTGLEIPEPHRSVARPGERAGAVAEHERARNLLARARSPQGRRSPRPHRARTARREPARLSSPTAASDLAIRARNGTRRRGPAAGRAVRRVARGVRARPVRRPR